MVKSHNKHYFVGLVRRANHTHRPVGCNAMYRPYPSGHCENIRCVRLARKTDSSMAAPALVRRVGTTCRHQCFVALIIFQMTNKSDM